MGVVLRADKPHVHTEQGLKHFSGKHVPGRSLRDDAPFQTDDAGGVMGHHAEVVAHHDLGELSCAAQIVQKFAEQAAAFEVHPGGRFVQHQQFGFLLKGEGKQHALHFSAGKRAHAALYEMRGVHLFQQGHGIVLRPAGNAEPERALLHAHGQKFRHGEGHTPVEHELLRHIAYAQALPAAEGDAASVVHFPQKREQQRGLARAVGADEHRAAASGHDGVHLIENVQPASGHAHMVENNGGGISFQGPAPECADFRA